MESSSITRACSGMGQFAGPKQRRLERAYGLKRQRIEAVRLCPPPLLLSGLYSNAVRNRLHLCRLDSSGAVRRALSLTELEHDVPRALDCGRSKQSKQVHAANKTTGLKTGHCMTGVVSGPRSGRGEAACPERRLEVTHGEERAWGDFAFGTRTGAGDQPGRCAGRAETV